MEAWKTNPTLELHPVAALSAATLRWGLDRFPSTLTTSLPASGNNYTATYPCGPDRDQLCTETVLCPSSSSSSSSSACLLLIAHAGSSTVGPARTNIVRLTHGLTVLFLLLATATAAAAAMRLLRKARPPPKTPAPKPAELPVRPAPRPDRLAQGMPAYYRDVAPAAREAEVYTTLADKPREVARVLEMLRGMFELDLSIWGMKRSTLEGDIRRMEGMRRTADALFAEVRRVVREWDEHDNAACRCWSEEERGEIARIRELVWALPAERYG
ncbi:hypothetical protein B0H67DRAFT_594749 [Lasiosphaeris hirsuta]|uniref:Uncharacterized protein n=1 Tax=Lasiosphaeris hirsuta TaxID=260670 RepID=A0AA39ZXX8_9PEZI|nr:hypothetical protein B0H67DRAFT_594749 [Lasiosphaeris hirsuta]